MSFCELLVITERKCLLNVELESSMFYLDGDLSMIILSGVIIPEFLRLILPWRDLGELI